MSLLGKILAVLNVVAAIAFAYLAVSDWAQRRSWVYATYRLDLTLHGLPVDETDVDVAGLPQNDKLSSTTLTDLFRGVALKGDQPPSTQLAAVTEVHDRLRKMLEGLADETEFKQRLTSLIVPLGRTLDERETLQKQIEQQPRQALLAPDGPFEQSFFGSLQNKSKDGKEEMGLEERRQAIARLLFGLSSEPAAGANPEEPSRQWTAVVIGLRAYTDVANQQSHNFREMADRLYVTLARDRGHFENDYKRVMGEIQLLNKDLEERKAELQRQKSLLEYHNTLLSARFADIEDIRKKLESSRQETAQTLATLAAEQKLLLEGQQRVGKAVEKNDALEQEIRNLERIHR
jgi:hypothetical protein